MPAERLSMRKIKEVLRLKFGLGLGHRQIARSCSINHSTVADYVRRAEVAGLGWPLPEGLDESGLETQLFPPRVTLTPDRPAPNWATIHEEFRGDKHVTLQLLWQEYRQSNPDGYSYSRFCELYRQWARKLDRVLRQEHRAGEKLVLGRHVENPLLRLNGVSLRQLSTMVSRLLFSHIPPIKTFDSLHGGRLTTYRRRAPSATGVQSSLGSPPAAAPYRRFAARQAPARYGEIWSSTGSRRARAAVKLPVCGRKRNGPRTALHKAIANRICNTVSFRNA